MASTSNASKTACRSASSGCKSASDGHAGSYAPENRPATAGSSGT